MNFFPEKGRGIDGPKKISQLGINATALRFLDLLAYKTIKVKVKGEVIRLPHPAYFAIHKLIVALRRTKREKSDKDKVVAYEILRILISCNQRREIKEILGLISKKWREKIFKLLQKDGEQEIFDFLN